MNKVAPVRGMPTGSSRHYVVKKINRYGVKQKRATWFDYDNSNFNIATVENEDVKSFSIKLIMHFIKKAKNQITVNFYKEVNAKKLDLVFSNEEELSEYIEIAQKMQQSLRESKFQSKQSVIFKEVVGQTKESRKFTWLGRDVTDATSGKSQNHQVYYNVLQVGIMSHEKRYLIFDYLTKEIKFMNNRNKIIKTIRIHDFSIKFYMQDPLKLVIYSPKSSIEILFASVYLKYHFASNYHLVRCPERVISSQKILKTSVKVYTSSWNIGQKADPTAETLALFLSGSENHQVVALGFQECKLSKFNLWLKALTTYFEERGSVLLSYISMWDMFLVVYIEKSLISAVSDIVTLKKATGVANIIGNKGGVLLSFRLENTSFCFISCHLAARFNRLLVRNQNAKDLLCLRPSLEDMEFSLEFDHIFWLGDFNYRIEEDFYKTIGILEERNFEVLWPHDQMLQQVSENQMFATFKEGPLNFKPTYRLIPNTDEWSNKREQTPSWTDRIIYKSHLPVDLLGYSSIDNCYGSDHRPIFASFNAEIRYWYVPQILPPLSDDQKLGVIEIQNLMVSYNREDSMATHAMVTFHSPYLEGSPKSTQVPLNTDGTAEFHGDKLPVLTFIFASPDVLKDLRFVMTLFLMVADSEKQIAGHGNLAVKQVVEFIENNYRVDYRVGFNTNKSDRLDIDLELNSRIVGKAVGTWTYNICSRSEQYRF